MGLDMYLDAEVSISDSYDFNKGEKIANSQVDDVLKVIDVSRDDKHFDDGMPQHVTISMNVMVWRKANAIHKWFVDNTQGGTDECLSSSVDRGQIIELCDLCDRALKYQDPSLLPPQEGFFFGSTDIDQWYWHDLKDTSERLRPLAKKFQSFSYKASW